MAEDWAKMKPFEARFFPLTICYISNSLISLASTHVDSFSIDVVYLLKLKSSFKHSYCWRCLPRIYFTHGPHSCKILLLNS